jgi:hypothetical protein
MSNRTVRVWLIVTARGAVRKIGQTHETRDELGPLPEGCRYVRGVVTVPVASSGR